MFNKACAHCWVTWGKIQRCAADSKATADGDDSFTYEKKKKKPLSDFRTTVGVFSARLCVSIPNRKTTLCLCRGSRSKKFYTVLRVFQVRRSVGRRSQVRHVLGRRSLCRRSSVQSTGREVCAGASSVLVHVEKDLFPI